MTSPITRIATSLEVRKALNHHATVGIIGDCAAAELLLIRAILNAAREAAKGEDVTDELIGETFSAEHKALREKTLQSAITALFDALVGEVCCLWEVATLKKDAL
jgi:hypothetical protein